MEKWPEVRIFGEPMRVRAEIASLDELSGHADQRELLEWIRRWPASLRKVFLVHGEPQQAATLAKLLKSQYNLEAVVPAPGQTFELSFVTETQPCAPSILEEALQGVFDNVSPTPTFQPPEPQRSGMLTALVAGALIALRRGQYLSVRADRPHAHRHGVRAGEADARSSATCGTRPM